MENIYLANDDLSRRQRVSLSYQAALTWHRNLHGLTRISWVTWIITISTIALWCFTAYQVALAIGAHSLHDILMNVLSNAINIQDKDNDALTSVLTTYGAKDNSLIMAGQYWRFVTPIFLHANLLHVGLNMLNFFVLGIMLERLVGHLRFLLIYLATGVVSIIASFHFAPQEVSVGASGADNYAHVGGLLCGCLLGWWFTPRYVLSPGKQLIDAHSLSRRWPLALLTITGTLVLAIIALHITGG